MPSPDSMQAPNMLQIRYCALSLGVLFLLLGLAGFAPSLLSGPMSAYPWPGYGYVLGLFPTNYFHSAIGILVGVWGLAAFTSLGGAIAFNQLFSIIYGIQAILGLLPFAKTLFGLMPLYGNNVWFSILTAAIAYYFGFVKPRSVRRTTGLTANV